MGQQAGGPNVEPAVREMNMISLAHLRARVALRLLAALGALLPMLAFGGLPTPSTVVGDVVTNPVTGADETVVNVLANSVLTDANNAIMIYYTVGDTFADPNDPNDPPATVTIVSAQVNPDTGLPESFTLDSNEVINVVSPVDTTPPPSAIGSPGDPGGPVNVPIPAGSVGVVNDTVVGASGADGRDGYGIQICDPTGIFGGCTIVGRSGSAGIDGDAPAPMNAVVDAGHGDIQSSAASTPGITVSSSGGNGGMGGDAYGNFSGYPGGDAGAGGTVTVTASTTVATAGEGSYGVFGKSASGNAGAGGAGYILGSGGSSGNAAQGGDVTITNNGDVTTFGADAIGVFGQSLGGASGAGGRSWGIVGSGGSGAAGGNGGNVNVTNSAVIITSGDGAFGVAAQSSGGTGGAGGGGVGVVAFGGNGSAGGNGGTATIRRAQPAASARLARERTVCSRKVRAVAAGLPEPAAGSSPSAARVGRRQRRRRECHHGGRVIGTHRGNRFQRHPRAEHWWWWRRWRCSVRSCGAGWRWHSRRRWWHRHGHQQWRRTHDQ